MAFQSPCRPPMVKGPFPHAIETVQLRGYSLVHRLAKANHIAAVRQATDAAGIGNLWILFDPELQPRLRSTSACLR